MTNDYSYLVMCYDSMFKKSHYYLKGVLQATVLCGDVK